MSTLKFTYCPGCGQRVVEGSMRCISCNTILKSQEDQLFSAEQSRKKRKKINLWLYIKLFIFAGVIYFVYMKYSGEITAIVNRVLGR